MNLVPFEGKRPQAPESIKIKTAQLVRSTQQGSKHFALRYTIEQSPSGTEVKANGKVLPIPEFGAIAYNWETHGLVAFEWELDKIIEENGIKARYRAEVWHAQNGEAKQLAEIWYASEIPSDLSLVEFIGQWLRAENKQKLAELKKLAPKPIQSTKQLPGNDEEIQVDHRQNVRAVCDRLLRREYQQFFRAFDNRLSQSEIRKAFLADCIALGIPHKVEETFDVLINERGFQSWLAAALKKPGRKVSPEEWELALGWISQGYHRMNSTELEKALNERTKLKLKGDSWQRKARRLGLISSRKPGPPSKTAPILR